MYVSIYLSNYPSFYPFIYALCVDLGPKTVHQPISRISRSTDQPINPKPQTPKPLNPKP